MRGGLSPRPYTPYWYGDWMQGDSDFIKALYIYNLSSLLKAKSKRPYCKAGSLALALTFHLSSHKTVSIYI
jgi:hypothetical protein